MAALYDVNEIRLMLRNLMSEMYNDEKICIYNRKELNMIIERIIYKLDPNNLPDIQHIKQLIKKEAKKNIRIF